jgi:hypothetical protein
LRSLPAFVGAEPMLSRRRLVARAAGQLAGDRASFAQDAVTGTVVLGAMSIAEAARLYREDKDLTPDMLDTIRDCMATYRPDDTLPLSGRNFGPSKVAIAGVLRRASLFSFASTPTSLHCTEHEAEAHRA